jgi:NADH:ubiquinone oxidoreductase subunit 4 (subunit M)
MVWETLAAIAMVVTAIYLLPTFRKVVLNHCTWFLEKKI